MPLDYVAGVTSVANSPGASGVTITVSAGESAVLGNPSTVGPHYATVCPVGTFPIFSGPRRNAEIVHITAQSGDNFTVTRARKGTTARTIIPTDQIFPTAMVEEYTNGALTAWGASISLTEDKGGAGRMRLARSGFTFLGASYNDVKRAGSLLQIGEYPETSDGAGNVIGNKNAAVFMTMQDMPSQVGDGSFVYWHVVARNSTALPSVWGGDVWVRNASNAGHAVGFETALVNTSGTNGLGFGLIVSGGGLSPDDGVSATNYAAAAIQVTSQGTTPNWKTGLSIDGIVTAANTGIGIQMTDALGSHAGWKYGIDMTGVTGGFTAAIFMPNAAKVAWGKASDGTLDGFIWQDSSNNLVFRAGAANLIWFEDQGANRLPFQVNTAALGTGSSTVANTGLLINYNNGSLQAGALVLVGAADSGGTGYRNLMVAN